MGGSGSERLGGGRPLVENCYRLDIETLVRSIAGRSSGIGKIVWQNDFTVSFEWSVSDPLYAWVQLRFSAKDYLDEDRQHDVEQLVYLCRSQPHLGGDRWWFACPREHRRVRMLYLRLGAGLFAPRRARRRAFASQRETVTARAIRRACKIRARLGGDAALISTPEKPLRMRSSTYSTLLRKLAAAEQVTNERLSRTLARWAQ